VPVLPSYVAESAPVDVPLVSPEGGMSTTQRQWLIRVAQEFLVTADTADEALALAGKLENRKLRGAKLTGSKAVLAPVENPVRVEAS